MTTISGFDSAAEETAQAHAGAVVHVDRRLGRGGQVAGAGDVVGVGVGLDDVGQAQTLLARQPEILGHAVPAGVHHDRLAGLATADQVAQAPRVLVDELLEDHRDLF